MQLPQKKKIMPQAEEQPLAAPPAQAPVQASAPVPAQEAGSSRGQASASAPISTESTPHFFYNKVFLWCLFFVGKGL